MLHYTTEDVFDPPCNYLRRPVLYLSPEAFEFLEGDMAEFLEQAREDFAKQVKNESDLRNMIKGIDGIDLEWNADDILHDRAALVQEEPQHL